MPASRYPSLNASEIIHIGDSLEHDVIGALDAGLHAIWFNPDNKEISADVTAKYHVNFYQVQCLSDIPAVIDTINKSPLHSRVTSP